MNKHFGCLAFLSLCLLAGTHGQETAVVDASKVNVRGKPTLKSEVVTQLVRGDKVVILEEIPDTDAKKNEPSTWARIKLPENTPVWVFAPFIKEGEVSVSRLNLRAGPGENYSVVGRVEKGDKIKPIRTVESWIEIEAPDDAYAFIALNLLDVDEGSSAATPETSAPATVESAPAVTKAPGPAKPAATPAEVAATPAPATPAGSNVPEPAAGTSAVPAPATTPTARPEPETSAPAATAETAAPETPEVAATAPQAPAQQLPSVAEPLASEEIEREAPKRVVRREGLVRPTRSIQAPTPFELIHPETKMAMNYLYGADIGVNLGEFRDMKVVVTGQEGIDPRWPNTPVLQLESIDTAP